MIIVVIKMNVLIIEDEKNLAQALCRIMEEEK